jgi:hypothetical protein
VRLAPRFAISDIGTAPTRAAVARWFAWSPTVLRRNVERFRTEKPGLFNVDLDDFLALVLSKRQSVN